jgi:hypothetical protein
LQFICRPFQSLPGHARRPSPMGAVSGLNYLFYRS